jgi:hypothetical protein
MRFTNYSKFTGHQADALNLKALLDRLSTSSCRAGSRGARTSIRTGASSGARGRPLHGLAQGGAPRALMESGSSRPRWWTS